MSPLVFFPPSPDGFEEVKAADNSVPLEAEVLFQQVGGRPCIDSTIRWLMPAWNAAPPELRCRGVTGKIFSGRSCQCARWSEWFYTILQGWSDSERRPQVNASRSCTEQINFSLRYIILIRQEIWLQEALKEKGVSSERYVLLNISNILGLQCSCIGSSKLR